MIQAICFDLDGTLFDDRQYVAAGLRAAGSVAADELGVDLTQAFMSAYFEEGVRERTFDEVLERRDLPTELVPRLVTAYHAQDVDLEPYPYAQPLLSELQRRYDLGLLTGGKNGADKLELLGLDQYFDVAIVAPSRGLSKESVEPFRELLDVLGVDAERTVFVGDNPPIDFPHPNALGMHTVRVNRGRFSDAEATADEVADHEVDALGDLPNLLERLDE